MLIVETVEPEGVGARAGIQAGDHLLSYEGQALHSPAALQALEENTFGKENLLLSLERDSQPLELSVASGCLGLQTRLQLPPALLKKYKTAQRLFQQHKYAEVGRRWEHSARQVDDSISEAWLMSKAGGAWEKASDWQQALKTYQAAWERLQDSTDTATPSQIAMALARYHQRRNEWEAAVGWYEQAGQLDRQAGREIWGARGLNGLGEVARLQGNLEAAQDYFTRALKIQKRLAPNSLDVATSLDNLGTVAWIRGELQSAEDYYNRALQIAERLAPNSQNVATSINNLGTVAWLQGDLQSAQDYYNRALQISERLAPNSLNVAIGLNNLGLVAKERGDLASAQEYYDRSLQIRERLAPNSLEVAASLNNLGGLAKARGDLQTAQDYHIRALHIFGRRAPNSREVASSLNNLGIIARIRGDLASAQDYYERSQQIEERLTPDTLYVANGLNNLGRVAHDRGDFEAARNYLVRALQIIERLAPNSLDVASNLTNRGYIAQKLGDLEAARDCHTSALQIKERLAPNSLDYADSLTDLGQILLHQQRPDVALPYLQQAVQTLEKQRSAISTPDQRALLIAQHTSMYANLIQCFLVLNQTQEAFTTLERSRARSLLELLSERPLVFTEQATPDLLLQQQALDRDLAHTYEQLARLSDTKENQTCIEQLLQQLRDLEHKQQDLSTTIRQTSPRYASLQYPQPLSCAEIQKAISPGTLLLSYLVDEEQTFLFALTSHLVRAFTLPVGRDTLHQHVSAFRSVLQTPSTQDSLATALKHGQECFDLLFTPKPQKKTQERRDTSLAPPQELLEMIQAARRLLVCPDGPLHTLPWSALVVPSGASTYYLAQDKPLSTTLSMTLLAQTRELPETAYGTANADVGTSQTIESSQMPTPPPRQRLTTAIQSVRSLLALGDPVYSRLAPALSRSAAPDMAAPLAAGGEEEAEEAEEPNSEDGLQTSPASNAELDALLTRGLTFRPLPYTREEVNAIQYLFQDRAQGQAHVRLGPDATKTALLQLAPNADLLHLACHGWFDARHPLSSGLILSLPETMEGAGPEGDNGLLQAWEVFSHLHLKADMVVLSACESGLGEEVRGEGLVGLTRAFLYAGARSLLVSLWKVDDLATAILMSRFYHYLLEDQGKGLGWDRDAALSAAQADVREVTVEAVLSEWLAADRIRELARGSGKLSRELHRRAQELEELKELAPGSCPFRHPYYWSGFVFEGESGPLPKLPPPV